MPLCEACLIAAEQGFSYEIVEVAAALGVPDTVPGAQVRARITANGGERVID